MSIPLDFDGLVDQYYEKLYRFAFSLSRRESDASDLTQETFYLWATKGGQLRDPEKVKAWLFTTLYREFLRKHRRGARFPEHELASVAGELPAVPPAGGTLLDWSVVLSSLAKLDENFQGPVILFYLEDHSYQEIAHVLGIPLGTVKSRLSRGLAQLKEIFEGSENQRRPRG